MVVATAPLGIRDAAVALPEATSQQPVTDSAPTARGGIQPRGGALRVLAIGDSLTQGSVPSKHLNHPYTLKLRPVLEGLVGQPVVAQDAGLGGGGIFMASEMKGYETVTFGPWLDTHLAQGPWSVVVVCVGINDLLRGGRAAADIAEGLAPMLDRVLATDTPVLLIPPFPAPGSVPNESDSKEEQRKLLPGLYRELAAKRAAATGGRGAQIWLLDLQSGPPFNFYAYAKSEAERAKWLDDGLHLTEFGYETLGEAVARELATHVAPAAAS